MPDGNEGLLLYHADWGRSCRAIWLLRELQVPFTLRAFDWWKIKDQAFLEDVCPLGRVPVLFDGTSCIYESGGIVEYLLEKYSQGDLTVPHGTVARAEYLQWFHMAETVGMLGVAKLYFYKMLPDSSPGKTEQLLNEGSSLTKKFLQKLDRHLCSKHPGEWVAGPSFTAADIMISYTLGLLGYSTTGPGTPAPQVLTVEDYPELSKYWDRMQGLSGYQETYRDLNFLPLGDHDIEPGMTFEGRGTRPVTTFAPKSKEQAEVERKLSTTDH